MYNKLSLDGTNEIKYHGASVFARNKVIDTTGKSYIDEEGFELLATLNGNIISVKATNKHIIIFSADSKYDEIGLYDFSTGSYSSIIVSEYLNFDDSNNIICEYYYTFNDELIITFVDGISETSNNIRTLNLNSLPFELDGAYELINPDEITRLNFIPDVNIPSLIIDSVDEAGSLKSGAYTIFVSYIFNNEKVGHYLTSTTPITIIEDSISSSNAYISGCVSDILTNKSVNFTVSDINEFVKYVRIGIMKSNDLVQTAYYKDFIKTSESMIFKLDSLDTYTTASLDSLLIQPVNYTKSKALTSFTKRAIYGNLITPTIESLQKYVNNIKVSWAVGNTPSYFPLTSDYKSNEYIVNSKTFVPGEVVALYIRVFNKQGLVIGDYHIAGREVDVNPEFPSVNEDAKFVNDASPGPNEIDISASSGNDSYQNDYFLGLDSNSDALYYKSRDTSSYNGGVGRMGFWENEDEVYPDDANFDVYQVVEGKGFYTGNTLRSRKIRHHVLPTQHKLLTEGLIATDNKSKVQLAISLSEIEFPDEALEYIQGYQIMYAVRNNNNSLIVDDAILHQLRNTESGQTELQISGTNGGDGFMSGTNYTDDFRFAIRPYNGTRSNAGINFTYLRGNYFKSVPFSSYGTLTHEDSDIFDGYDDYKVSLQEGVTTIEPIKADEIVIRTINNSIGRSSTFQDVNNIYNEEMIHVEALKAINTTKNHFLSVSLVNYYKNCYFKYNEQDLAIGSPFITISNSIVDASYGDAFIGNYSYKHVNGFILPSSGLLYKITTLMNMPIYSNSNVALRHSLTNDNIFYPNLSDGVYTIDDYMGFHYSKYDSKLQNPDFAKLNDYKQDIIFDINNVFVDSFPFRYIVSNPVSTESLAPAWTNIDPEAYVDVDYSKGSITSLHGNDRQMYVQCEDTLYVMQLKGELEQINTESLSIRDTDVFTAILKEVILSEDGYIGCTETKGSVLTPYGYYVLDNNKKRIFQINGDKPKDITIGIQSELNKYDFDLLEDNIYNNKGVIVYYNEEDRLVLFTVVTPGYQVETDEQDEGSQTRGKYFTLSFSLRTSAWCSFHGYFPLSATNNANSVISSKYNLLFKHNDKTTVGKYYRNKNNIDYNIQDNVVDYIFNAFLNQDGQYSGGSIVKLFDNVEINAEIHDVDGNYIYDRQTDYIMCYNDRQCTGMIIASNRMNFFEQDNVTIINGVGKFNNILDAVRDNNLPILDENYELIESNLFSKNYFDLSKFISKFMVVRLVHTNSNKSVYEKQIINSINVNFDRLNK